MEIRQQALTLQKLKKLEDEAEEISQIKSKSVRIVKESRKMTSL